MKQVMVPIALLALFLLGCEHPRERPGVGSSQNTNTNVGAWSFFGKAKITYAAIQCAGRATLVQGEATVKDSCFTGDTNVVLCTDVSAANPVRCTPSRGALSIGGSGADTVVYARVH